MGELPSLSEVNSSVDNLINASTSAPYVPCSPHLVLPTLNALQLSCTDVLVDLGCGDGRFMFSAAKLPELQSPKKIIGIDHNPLLISYLKSKLENNNDTYNKIEVVQGDFFQMDLCKFGATAVIAYLTPEVLDRLKPSLSKWLLHGRSISDESKASDFVLVKRHNGEHVRNNVGRSLQTMSSHALSTTISLDAPPPKSSSPSNKSIPTTRSHFSLTKSVNMIQKMWSSLPDKLKSKKSKQSVTSNQSINIPPSLSASASPKLSRSVIGRRIATVMFSIPGWEPAHVKEVKEEIWDGDRAIVTDFPGIYVFYYDQTSIK